MKNVSDNASQLSSDEEQESFLSGRPLAKPERESPTYRLLPWIANLILVMIVILLLLREKRSSPKIEYVYRDQEVYSPARDAIEYQTTVFVSSFGEHKTKYQGPPTDEVDENWDELYDAVGITRIDRDMAKQLPNRTVPIPGDTDHYIVGLDVFHQLHCLNNLRKLIWPERYHVLDMHKESEEAWEDHINHLDHCVDNLRQALMCHGDISTLYWEWIPESQRALAHAETTHTCRNFDRIWQWAFEHKLDGDFDSYVHVADPLYD